MSSGGTLVVTILLSVVSGILNAMLLRYVRLNKDHAFIQARSWTTCSGLILLATTAELEFFAAINQDGLQEKLRVVGLNSPLILIVCGLYLINIGSLLYKLQITQEILNAQQFVGRQKADHNKWFTDHRYLVHSILLMFYFCAWTIACFIGLLMYLSNGDYRNVQIAHVALTAICVVILVIFTMVARKDDTGRWGLIYELNIMCVFMSVMLGLKSAYQFLLPESPDSAQSSIQILYMFLYFFAVEGFLFISVGLSVLQAEKERSKGLTSANIGVAGIRDEEDLEEQALTSFEKYLEDPKFFALFREKLAQEHSAENLQFYSECKKLRQKAELDIQVDNMDENERNVFEAACMRIFDTYIKEDSEHSVNISYETRQQIIQKAQLIIQKRLPQDPSQCISYLRDVFALAEKNVFMLMRDDPFKRFLRSPEFEEYRSNSVVSNIVLKANWQSSRKISVEKSQGSQGSEGPSSQKVATRMRMHTM